MADDNLPARAVVVVIPTRNRPALLERTLVSLADADRPARYRGTYVVENGPAVPAVARVVEGWRDRLAITFRTLADGNKSAALNAVLADLNDELVVFLDDDVRVAPGLLTAYAREDEKAAGRTFFGGPTDVDYEVPPPAWLRAYLPPSAVGWRWTGHPHAVDRPEFLGFNWAARARDLQAAGGFNAAFGPGARTGATGQERNMQERLLQKGWIGRYVEEAVVWHYVPRDRCSRRWTLRRAYRNGVGLGLSEALAPEHLIAGVPRWVWGLTVRKGFMSVRALLDPSPERRFYALQQFIFRVGQIRGIRERARGQQAARQE
jgi:glycosyltransferase involved in cell wall biosynthesis